MKNFVRALLFSSAGLAMAALLSSCAESSSGGGSTAIPQIQVSCTSAACNAVSSPNVVVLITAYDCASYQFAVASSSMSINCTPGAGCYGVTSSWINLSGATITTIPAGTYNICGRIDYNHNYPSILTDDTTSLKTSVTISSSSSGPISLTSWTDP